MNEFCLAYHISSALELTFAANVLVLAFGGFYNTMEDRQKELVIAADEFTKNKPLREEISIENLWKIIKVTSRLRKLCWHIGWFICLIASVCVYVVMWHFPELDLCAQPIKALSVFFTYAGPTAIALMIVIERTGYWRASKLRRRLQIQADGLESSNEQNFTRLYRLLLEELSKRK